MKLDSSAEGSASQVPSQEKKTVAVFDPEITSRAVIIPMLEQLGYRVDEHHTQAEIASYLSGKTRVDMVFLHLAVFGETYAEVTKGLDALSLSSIADAPPVLAISVLSLSAEARTRLESSGCNRVLSRQAPLMEVVFAVNQLLFPKIRELRRYTRVFGGFPIHLGGPEDWHAGQVYNISREGAFIQCEQFPDEGSRIQVRFVLPELEKPFQVEALVSWVNRKAGDPLSPQGIGISFMALGAEAQTTLGRFIASREDGNDLGS
jgi:CheY-like chemotaxis protein